MIPFLDLKKINEQYSEQLKVAASRVIDSGWYITGKEVEEFEKNFAAYCGTKHCVGVSNGLDALKLILKAMEIGEGDEVIVPSNTYIASILAISEVGATPILVEPDLATYNINPCLIEEKITNKTKAILVVHLYGRIAEMSTIQRIAKKYQLWMAEYPDYEVTPYPNYNYFPSFENIGIFQFTSTYVAGGLDGNVDLTGITDNGYTKNNQPETNTPAIEEGKEVEKTPTSAVKVGDTVKVKFNVDAWATGEAIPDWVKGNSYKVQEVTGSRVLLEGILSWISKGDIELLPDATTVPNKQPEATHVVQYGETLSSIAYQYGTDYQTLAALNGLANPNLIYPGQILKVNGSVVSNIYTVQYGDNLSSIAAKLGTTYQTLAALNGLANPNLIYPGQTLSY